MLSHGKADNAVCEKFLSANSFFISSGIAVRLNYLYQTQGGTYELTSALTQISENQEELNKTAVEKRIVNSAAWLKWLCENLSRQEGFLIAPPEWLKEYHVNLVDASDYACNGS